MPYVDFNGDDLFFTAHDNDGTRNLVCIHGAGEDHGTWPAGLGALPDCNAWLLDLPGHGRSTAEARHSIDAYADDVSTFVQAMELEQVTLVGHSMGGAIAMNLALRHPPWLNSLILVCTGARLRILPEMRHLIRTNYPLAMERLAALAFAPSAPPNLRESLKARMQKVDPAVYDADFNACDGFDIIDRLNEISHKTLIISGDIDHMTPLKYSQFLEDRMPDARLAVIAPAGHYLPREQPENLIQIIQRFLADTKIA